MNMLPELLQISRKTPHKVPSFSSYAFAGLTVLLLQFVFLSYAFPLGELFSTLPLTTVDNAFHQFQTFLAIDLANQGKIVGYDTHFAAGYVGGVTFNASAKFPAFIAWLLNGVLNPVITYKLYVFFSALLAPLCLPLAARLLYLDLLTTWIATLFGLLLWWASGFHWYHTVGMVSYVFMAYFSIPYCAGIYRVLQADHQWSLSILLGVFGAGAFFLHPFFPVAIAFFVVLLHAFNRHEYPLKRSIFPLLVIVVIAILPNLIWFLTMVSSPSFADAGASPYEKVVDPMTMWWEITGRWTAHAIGAKIYPLLAVLAAAGSWFGVASLKAFTRTSLGVWAALILFSSVGAAIPFIGPLQPNRFSTMGYLFLVLPASMGLASFLRFVVARGWRPGFAVVPMVVLFPLSVLVAKEFSHEVSSIPTGRYGKPPPEVQGLGENNKALLQWITEHTSKSGRILFETSSGRIHDGSHISGLLAYLSDREFIGGPYVFLFFAGSSDGHVFGKPIQSIDEAVFQRYLDTYNIGWVMAHTPESIAYLNSSPTLKQVAQIGVEHIYQANRPLSYILAGQGDVEVRDRALVVHVPVVNKPVLLSYHYIPQLNADDGSVITPVHINDDPKPFIELSPKSNTVVLCDTHPCNALLLNK